MNPNNLGLRGVECFDMHQAHTAHSRYGSLPAVGVGLAVLDANQNRLRPHPIHCFLLH
jgi:hypothetical protein